MNKISGFKKLGSKRMLTPVNSEVCGEGLGEEVVALNYLVQHLMCFNG